MITKLTKEQEDLLPIYRDKWLKIGLSTEVCNRNNAESAVKRSYKIAGLNEPSVFFWADSPVSGALMKVILEKTTTQEFNQVRDQVWDHVRDQVGNQVRAQVRDQVWDHVRDQAWNQVRDQVGAQVRDQVRDQVGDQVWAQVGDQVRSQVWDQIGDQVFGDQVGNQVGAQVWDQVYGAHDSEWLSFYSFILEVLKIRDCQKLTPLMELAKNCGWWAPYKNIVILQEKPCEIHIKDKKLHNENGPSILYRDGFCVYALNGVRVPEWIIKTPKYEITTEQVLSEKNVEIRRELIRKIGVENFAKKAGSKVLSKKDSYELISINLGESIGHAKYLKMKNPSIDTWHLEGVHPDCETVDQALSFRNFGNLDKSFKKPEVLT